MPLAPRKAPLTVLVTGFGPFPGAAFNPTGELAARLVRRRRPALADVRLIGHVFETSYMTVDRELPDLIARHRPDVLLMFGLAARTPHLRIETCARNRRSVLLTDEGGELPRAMTIRSGSAAMLSGRAPFIRMWAAARVAGMRTRLSRDAGRYLCNYIYRQALELPATRRPRVVAFVHVPKVRRGARPVQWIGRSVAPYDLVRAGEAILLVLASAARR